METVTLAIHSGTVALEPVQEEDERDNVENDADAATPVPRARSGHPMPDPQTGIILLIPVPELRQVACAPLASMTVDVLVAQEDSPLALPPALAIYRSKHAAGERLVTRERTTTSLKVAPPPI